MADYAASGVRQVKRGPSAPLRMIREEFWLTWGQVEGAANPTLLKLRFNGPRVADLYVGVRLRESTDGRQRVH